jgi:hypothetical protein
MARIKNVFHFVGTYTLPIGGAIGGVIGIHLGESSLWAGIGGFAGALLGGLVGLLGDKLRNWYRDRNKIENRLSS